MTVFFVKKLTLDRPSILPAILLLKANNKRKYEYLTEYGFLIKPKAFVKIMKINFTFPPSAKRL